MVQLSIETVMSYCSISIVTLVQITLHSITFPAFPCCTLKSGIGNLGMGLSMRLYPRERERERERKIIGAYPGLTVIDW